MAQIEVDFEVWKALTVRRTSEAHSLNEVLRELLKIKVNSPQKVVPLTASIILESAGLVLGGRHLPEATQLRARYKGKFHHAAISGGRLINEKGEQFASVSAAARAITKNNVNGLTFWQVQRPGEGDWRKLVELPRIDR